MSQFSAAQFRNYAGYISATIVSGIPTEAAVYRSFYQSLKAYYNTNDVYEIVNQVGEATRFTNKDMQPLRNPVHRCVEFYAAKLWPGHDLAKALPIITENDTIIDPIHRIWKASNFAMKKQMAARQYAMLGDMFIKVETKEDEEGRVTSVYIRFIDATYVSDFELDERGYVTYIRLDIPKGQNERYEEVVHTEVWDKATTSWRIWEHVQGLDVKIDKIKTTPESGNYQEAYQDDFIPFVYVPFLDDGNGRASAPFVASLDKIDEVNRKATRLAQLLFRHGKADKMLTSTTMDKTGRPMPPPKTDDLLNSSDQFVINGETFYKLPSGWGIEHLIANIDYDSHLKSIESDIKELEQDMPELVYSRISDSDNLSGRALRYMLEGAISRLLEARGNGESAFIRATQMALTIAKNAGLEPFKSLPDFDSGNREFVFAERPVLLPDRLEQSQTAATWVSAGAGLEQAAIEAGVKEERAAELARLDIIPVDTPTGAER